MPELHLYCIGFSLHLAIAGFNTGAYETDAYETDAYETGAPADKKVINSGL